MEMAKRIFTYGLAVRFVGLVTLVVGVYLLLGVAFSLVAGGFLVARFGKMLMDAAVTQMEVDELE